MKLPFGISVSITYEKKSSRLVLDEEIFEECKSKVVPVWSWKRVKTIKYVVHFKGKKFHIKELD